jgi:predicted transposase/invertase (TIGR01784 family)
MKTDHLFYQLFQQFPESFFEMIGSANQADNYRFDAIEVKEAAFRMDGAFLPKDNAIDSPIYFIEVQFKKDLEIYARLFSEIFIFLRRHHPQQRWQAVVIYPSRSQDFTHREAQPYAPMLNSNLVQRIYLNELEIPSNSSLGLEIVKLMVEKDTQVPPTVSRLVNRVQTEATNQLEKQKIIEFIETVVLYKLPNLSKEELAAMFATDDLRKTRFAQEMKEEGIAEGKAEGIAEGKAEGIAEGNLAAQKKMILKLFNRDFPVEEIAELVDLSVEQVQQIIAQQSQNNESS